MEQRHDLDRIESPPPSHWTDSLSLAAVALGLRLVHLLSLRGLPTFDSPIMDEAYQADWARRIAGGDWLGHEVFFRAPLHAYTLGLIRWVTGDGAFWPRLVQILLGTAGVVLLHRIGLRLGGRMVAAIAAGLAAVCWPMIFFDAELLTVSLEVFFSLLALFLLLKSDTVPRRRLLLLLAGLALGLAADTRPNMLVFLPGAAAWAAWSDRGLRARAMAAGLVAAGVCAAVLPVTARNLAVGGDLVLIASQGGVNFYIGNNPAADGTTAVVPGTRPTWDGGYDDAISIARQARGDDLGPSGISRYWYGRGLAFWREQPRAALALTFRKIRLLLGGEEISNNKDLTFFRDLSPITSLPLPAGSWLIPLGLVGWVAAWTRHRSRRRALILPLLFAVPYAGTIVMFFVTSRYRVPLMPVFALGTAWFVAEILCHLRPPAWRPLAAWCLAAALLVLTLNAGPSGYLDDPAQGHLALATAYHASGRLDEALAEYDRAIAMAGPYEYEALHRRGQVLEALGRSRQACLSYGDSARMRPDNTDAVISYLTCAVRTDAYPAAREQILRWIDPVAGELAARVHFTVGSLDESIGRLDDAEAQYRRGLAAEPDHFACRLNLALLLRRQGRLGESLAELREAARSHPSEPSAQIHLAGHYLAVGDEVSARWHADRARRLGGEIGPQLESLLAHEKNQREGKNLMSAPR